MASRTHSKGKEARDAIVASPDVKASISTLQLDVTDESSIAAAVKNVENDYGRLDVLINNAGISSKAATLKEQLESTLNTNVIGAALMTEAFTPLLLKSKRSYLLHVSSFLGSLSSAADSPRADYQVYRTSKAALNMLMLQDWKALGPQGIKVFAVCPGLVESNLRGVAKEQVTAGGRAGDPEVSGRTMLKILEGERDGDVGKFVHKDGIYPW